MREQVLGVSFSDTPNISVRIITQFDNKDLKIEKKKFPFILKNQIEVFVQTNLRCFSFGISEDYIWNGADIPKIFWRSIGSSSDTTFLVASMVHDFMLEFKEELISEIFSGQIKTKDYRRLTSLIFRALLKLNGVNVIKANLMSFSVQLWQSLFCRRQWCLKKTRGIL